MARVQVPLPPALAGGQMHQRSEHVGEKPKYTVMMEQVTERKKQLMSKTSYKIQPPEGFTFISLSETALTDVCKEISRQDGVPIHIVTTSKGGHRSTELSQQVGRVGHHFASQVVAKAMDRLGLDMDAKGRIRKQFEQARKAFGNETARKEQKGTHIGENVKDPKKRKHLQDELNKEATAMLKTLFPGMPEKDVKAVVKHAFAIGKDRIGSSAELPLDRRVHLAVLAHIRHGYTDYDKLLAQVPYQTARSIVEQPTLTKIIEWRGETSQDEYGAVEDILREVIVIDDDDDDKETPESPRSGDEDLIFSSQQIPADQIDNRPSSSIGGPPGMDFNRYAYGRAYERRDTDRRLVDHERLARQDAMRQQRYQETRQQLISGPYRAEYHPSSGSNGSYAHVERRILVPADEPQRILVRTPHGLDRELIPLRQNRNHDSEPSHYRNAAGFMNTQAPKVGAVSSTSESSRNTIRYGSPLRQGEVIHQSIESPSKHAIHANDPSGSIPHSAGRPHQAQMHSDYRFQNSPVKGTNHPRDAVLGKRPQPDHNISEHPMKAQRVQYASHPQMVILSEAEHRAHEVHPRDSAVTLPRQTMNTTSTHEDERRYAYSSRRMSDQNLVRRPGPDAASHIEPSSRPRSPGVQYVRTHRASGSLGSLRRMDNESRIHRPMPATQLEAPHPSYVHQLDGANEVSYIRNDVVPVFRQPHPVNYELQERLDSRDSILQSRRRGAQPHQDTRRIIYDGRYEPEPVTRQIQLYGEHDRRAVEHPQSAMQDMRLYDQAATSQPMYDEQGRRIIVLERPR